MMKIKQKDIKYQSYCIHQTVTPVLYLKRWVHNRKFYNYKYFKYEVFNNSLCNVSGRKTVINRTNKYRHSYLDFHENFKHKFI